MISRSNPVSVLLDRADEDGSSNHGKTDINAQASNKRSLSPGKGGRVQQMTADTFLTCSSLVRFRNETKDAFLRRLTHLQLQNQRFGAFDKLQAVPSVQVIYAYENRITSLTGLENLRSLQQLFMQNNLVKSLSGLEALPHLRKLHLGHNQIRHIDSLESCRKLEELRVSYQHVGTRHGVEIPMTFCPKSIAAIAPTLRVLEVAGNRLPNLLPLVSLTALQELDARDNFIAKVLDFRELLENALSLTRVELAGNPFATNERKYRAIVVLCCEHIEQIDEKEVSSSERTFVRKLEEQKMKARRSPVMSGANEGPSEFAHPLPAAKPQAAAKGMVGAAVRKTPSNKSLRAVQDDPWTLRP